MKLDLRMGYYNILLNDAANKICTTTTPFGKYKYNRLPMCVWILLDMFHEWMSDIINDIYFVIFYPEDFLIITSVSFEEHLSKVYEVAKRL